MKLTMPQIIMLNHATTVNHENSERRYAAKKKNKSALEEDARFRNERENFEEMTPASQSNYLAGIGSF